MDEMMKHVEKAERFLEDDDAQKAKAELNKLLKRIDEKIAQLKEENRLEGGDISKEYLKW